MTDPREQMLARFERFQDGRAGWTLPVRKAAIDRFAQLGFPTTSTEAWKYTPVAPLLQVPFELAPRGEPSPVSAQQVDALAALRGGLRLVFVNGHFEPGLSSLTGVPAGVVVKSLGAALVEDAARLEPHLLTDGRTGPFAALNTAFAEDGAFISLPQGAVLEQPIELVFLAGGSQQALALHPRTLIVAGAASQATVVETYVAIGQGVYFTNAVTQVVLGPDAHVDHYKVQAEGPRAFHIAQVRSQQERGSHFGSHSIALGGQLARTEVEAVLGAEGSACTLNGLYMAGGKQHLDNHTRIEHAQPHCTSRELYKGVLDGHAHGVFTGQIVVAKDAQKTDASQTNKNLLLSEDATVDTTPRLEIFADDVKCTHGATVGQLDEDALFYLRSRGIGERTAKDLLTFAFASEMVSLIRLEPLRARVRELVTQKLPHASQLRESAS